MDVLVSGKDNITLANSDKVFEIMQKVLLRENYIDREKEHFWILGLNMVNNLLFVELVALGSVKAVNLEPMNVFRVSVLKGATSVIMVHNHPSGNLKPSDADKDVTDRLIQVGKILAINVIDHMIITPQSYMSFCDIGLMDELEKSIKWTPSFVVAEQIKKEEKKIRQDIIKKSKEDRKKAIKNKEVQIAKEMKKDGEFIDKIMKYTGLTREEIEKLK